MGGKKGEREMWALAADGRPDDGVGLRMWGGDGGGAKERGRTNRTMVLLPERTVVSNVQLAPYTLQSAAIHATSDDWHHKRPRQMDERTSKSRGQLDNISRYLTMRSSPRRGVCAARREMHSGRPFREQQLEQQREQQREPR
mmetsp:Transcript_63769/g.106036  ORF Transcript_63769/g.106036 Transcript_63769/m.106036 type:complete len:142 (+) Transcript_63769:140-565(+)